MHGTVFPAQGMIYVKTPRQGETSGPVEDLRVDGVVGTVRERQNKVSGDQEAGPIIEKVDGSHMRV